MLASAGSRGPAGRTVDRMQCGVTSVAMAACLAACGGSHGSSGTTTGGSVLQGDLSFPPNAVLAIVYSRSDGGLDPSRTGITFAKTNPPFGCEYISASLPDS